MKCHQCGSEFEQIKTDLPFKVSDTAIVVVKGVPVLQCQGCREYLLEDEVMARIDAILDRFDGNAELEVVPYAA